MADREAQALTPESGEQPYAKRRNEARRQRKAEARAAAAAEAALLDAAMAGNRQLRAAAAASDGALLDAAVAGNQRLRWRRLALRKMAREFRLRLCWQRICDWGRWLATRDEDYLERRRQLLDADDEIEEETREAARAAAERGDDELYDYDGGRFSAEPGGRLYNNSFAVAMESDYVAPGESVLERMIHGAFAAAAFHGAGGGDD